MLPKNHYLLLRTYYFFAAGLASQPNLGYCQEKITKVYTLIATLDDVSDAYGILEELVLFTDAINKYQGWDSILSTNDTKGHKFIKTKSIYRLLNFTLFFGFRWEISTINEFSA